MAGRFSWEEVVHVGTPEARRRHRRSGEAVHMAPELFLSDGDKEKGRPNSEESDLPSCQSDKALMIHHQALNGMSKR